MHKKRILFLSAFYPNPSAPNIATYNKQILFALTDYYDIDAVVPIPWINRLQTHSIPSTSSQLCINVYYPSYFYTPYIMRFIYGYFYYYSVINTVIRLIQTNNYDLIYSSWLFPDAWAAARIAKKYNIPLFVSVLGSDVNRLKPDSSLMSSSLEVTRSACKVICVCNVLKQKLIGLGCSPDKLVYLQNGVDRTIFFPKNKNETRLELGVGINDKIILYVGNLKKEKGLRELVESISYITKKCIYDNVKLIIIGDGQFKTTLNQLTEKYDIQNNTTLLGGQSLNTISSWMSASDVLCLPSYTEGQPNVIIEALACQTKVVASNVGGIPDLDDGSGIIKLVLPQCATSLTEALIEMIDKDITKTIHSPVCSWQDYAVSLKDIFEHGAIVE